MIWLTSVQESVVVGIHTDSPITFTPRTHISAELLPTLCQQKMAEIMVCHFQD